MAREVDELRRVGREALEQQFGALMPLRGKGVQYGSRYSFQQNGKTVSCAIKVSQGLSGRIHFPFSEGTWGVLSEVDYVLYVRQKESCIEVQFYNKSVILAAFDRNRAAALAGNFTNLPAWLSPDEEFSYRFAGSGFGRHALWTKVFGEALASTVDQNTPATPTEKSAGHSSIGALIEVYKQAIARELRKQPEDIQITVRW